MGWKKTHPSVQTEGLSGGSLVMNTKESFGDSPNVMYSKLEPIVEIESLLNKEKVNSTN